MSALLRQGARRIGGYVLHRSQATVTSPAVAEQRRRLVPRRMYSTKEIAIEEIPYKIQQKKEELYDEICKERSFGNKRLLQLLSVQVKPRPGDYKWHLLRFSKWSINVVEIAGLVALTSMVGSGVLRITCFIGNTKVVRAMTMRGEAREAETRSGLEN